MDKTAVESWYGYRSKFNIKYVLPSYLFVNKMSDRGASFESGNWNPTAGTGYPYSGQAFVYQSNYLNDDPVNASGIANVQASEDTSPANISIYVFVSGTVNPSQSSSWYQWQSGIALIAGTPANQVGGINRSGNSIYSIPSNSSITPIQVSGKTPNLSGNQNVPTSESSWNV